MNTPEWLRPGLSGVAIGAVGLAIIGFTWGGWMTANTAAQTASSQSHAAVVNALLPLCIEASKQDPQLAAKLVSLKSAMFFERGNTALTEVKAYFDGLAALGARMTTQDQALDPVLTAIDTQASSSQTSRPVPSPMC